jgi:hypothetical protein
MVNMPAGARLSLRFGGRLRQIRRKQRSGGNCASELIENAHKILLIYLIRNGLNQERFQYYFIFTKIFVQLNKY